MTFQHTLGFDEADGTKRDLSGDRLLHALPMRERPAHRVSHYAAGCSLVELLAAVLRGRSQIETASELLVKFRELKNLANATPGELMAVRGVGPARAAALKAAMELGRRVMFPGPDGRPAITTPEDAAALLLPIMQNLEQEHLVTMVLDTRNRLVGEPVEIYRGSLNSSLVRIAEIFRPAIRANAAAIIVAHSHPSGDPTPSPEDVSITKAMVEAGQLLDVTLLDHLVIGRGRFVSLKSRGLGFS
jgi:DNA repair protein RadC